MYSEVRWLIAQTLKAKEFLAKSIFVSLLGSQYVIAEVFLPGMRRLPFIDVCDVMID
jgi:hypothetical protein